MTTPEIDPSLLLRHRDWLRRLARRLITDASAADDLVQETWMAAIVRPRPREAPTRAWLAGVLRNKALSRLRAEGRRAQRERAAAGALARIEEPGRHLEAVEVGQRLTEHVLALSPPLRDAIVLRYFHDRSTRAIAEELGVSESTIRTRLARALGQLRDELDANEAERDRWRGTLGAFVLAAEPARRASGLAVAGWAVAGLVACAAGMLVLRARGGPGSDLPELRPNVELELAVGPSEPVLPGEPHEASAAERGTSTASASPPVTAAREAASDGRARTLTGRVVQPTSERSASLRVLFAYWTGADEESIRTIEAQVDAFGTFALETTESAPGRLVAVASGLRPASIELARGESRANVQLVLEPGATVTGTVASEAAPVAVLAERKTEAPVFTPRFCVPLAWGAERIESVTATTVSDDDGHFELAGLEPGPHAFLVQPVSRAIAWPELPDARPELVKYRATRFVMLSTPEEAAQVLIAPASGVELSSRARTVLVRVLDHGQPLEQFHGRLGIGSEQRPRNMTDGVLVVAYDPDQGGSLRLAFPGYDEEVLQLPEDDPGHATREILVELERTSPPIELRLRLDGDFLDRVAIELRESPRGGLPFWFRRELDVVGGEVRVPGLFPGSATLRIGPVADASATSYLVPMEQETLVERDSPPLELALERGGRVELLVHEDAPGSVSLVAAASASDRREVPLNVGTSNWNDGDLLPHAHALRPGRYVVTFEHAIIGRGHALPPPVPVEILAGATTRVHVQVPRE